MAENIANISAVWSEGALYVKNPVGNTMLKISSTGAEGIFFGYLAQTTTFAAAATLSHIHMGKLILCTTDDVVLTLLSGTTTGIRGDSFTIINSATDGAAKLVIKFPTTELICGNGTATTTSTHALINTKATHIYGDRVTVNASGTLVWSLEDVIGTWALSAGT